MTTTARYSNSTAYLCPSGCYLKTTPKRQPCTRCCGFTADTAKHFQGGTPAATKN